MIEFNVRFDFDASEDDILARFGLEDHGPVQQAIDKAIIDYMMPYWAWDTGTLARSAYSATDIGSGHIIYPGPYAHYMAMGEVYGPNIPVFDDDSGVPTRFFSPPGQPKSPTGRAIQYKTDVNPLAGAHPFERMLADHREDIIEEARSVATSQ